MRLNISIPISLTGLTLAAIVLGAYHHFVEALVPATGMDLLWILYVASGFNLYGYFFRFRSLIQPSAYKRTYRDLVETLSWVYGKIKANYRLPLKYSRRAIEDDPLLVATWICYGIGVLGEYYVGGVAYAPFGACIILIVGRELRDFTNTSEEGGSP